MGALGAAAGRRGEIGFGGGLMVAPGVFEGGGAHGAAVALGDHGPEVDAVGVVDAVEAGDVNYRLFVEFAAHVFGDEPERFAGLRGAVGEGNGFGEDGDVVLGRRGAYSVCRRAVSIGVGGEAEGWESSLLEIVRDSLGWRCG